MNNILKVGLIGAGAYILYEYILAPALQAQVAEPGTTNVTGTTPEATNVYEAVTQPAKVSPGYPALTATQLYGAADPGVTRLNPDQWAYYYNQLTGLRFVAMDPMFGGVGTDTREATYTAEEWLSKVSQYFTKEYTSISGLGRLYVSGWERDIKYLR